MIPFWPFFLILSKTKNSVLPIFFNHWHCVILKEVNRACLSCWRAVDKVKSSLKAFIILSFLSCLRSDCIPPAVIRGTGWGLANNTHSCFNLVLRHSLAGLRTPATAAVIQTAPPVTHRQTAATPPAPPQMTATAAATATMTALPPPLPPPPPRPRTAQTQEAAVIQIKDLQGRRKRRNELICQHKIVAVCFLLVILAIHNSFSCLIHHSWLDWNVGHL